MMPVMMPVVMASVPTRRFAVILLYAGIVTIAVGVIIATISLTVMGVMSGFGTVFHGAGLDYAAATVTVATRVIIAAICLTVMGMIFCFRTI